MRIDHQFVYMIPVGHNPLGHTMSLERKKELYAIACAHDLLIIEDDPYFHLEFGPTGANIKEDEPIRPPPSFFAIDAEQRVLRFDSFSKILSAGLRLGWVTGPAPLVERIALHIQV